MECNICNMCNIAYSGFFLEVTVNTCNICNISSSGKKSAEWVTLCEKICRVGNACNICDIDLSENSAEGVMHVICVIW